MNQYPSMQHSAAKAEVVNAFMRGVYGWMSAGLALTAAVSYAVVNTSSLLQMFFNVNPSTGAVSMSTLVFVLLLAEIGIVFFLSARIRTLAPGTATALFLVYSGLNGLTLTPILLAYTAESVASTFVITAGMFGAMSLYGLLTKKDLTSWGSLLFMGLIGIMIAMVVNMFIQSSAMAFAISGIGVIIFLGLTAYDTQKLKTMGEMVPAGDEAAIRRGTIMGALTLYLDFINLFLMLLRLMGDRR
ncbi:Bax inhibitor-1/YccA family protein [Pseudodesulfovibrio piezophilus]|uniref:Inner membrane protein ybhL n=1 Tax=Pseudodesulfovibrio piezophilus (strain DSM 21447 / JCM 15486 / C1TLV30) TaxID=1322246 RepID=M1WKP6_PSEP2|nr:Bax inhibitor-1/YccA family protein [Pseudodesulfovibrio piezophilus]CCH49966.1 Inner membrane protein ybhL [Pseudodesulfovibrio piezophilus C1TLV30]